MFADMLLPKEGLVDCNEDTCTIVWPRVKQSTCRRRIKGASALHHYSSNISINELSVCSSASVPSLYEFKQHVPHLQEAIMFLSQDAIWANYAMRRRAVQGYVL